MERKKHFSRAHQDRERSRRIMQEYIKAKQLKSTQDSTTLQEYRTRFMAPYAMLIYVFTFLFFLGWITTRGNSFMKKEIINADSKIFQDFNISSNNTILKFNANQNIRKGTNYKRPDIFSLTKTPIYSELEIEILDKDYNHVYSVYKNLWLEYHEGYEYKDTQMDFQISFEKAGQYFIRAINHNNNNGPITMNIYNTKPSLYFFNYFIIFIILNVILFFGNSYWGTTTVLFKALKKIKSIKHNTKFLITASLVCLIFTSCVVISISHYGYASTGDEIRLPNKFFVTNGIIYLG